MPRKKSAAQLQREIDALYTVHRVQFQVPGSPWVWVGERGSGTMNPDAAFRYPSREAAETAVRAMTGPRSSLLAKAVSTKAG